MTRNVLYVIALLTGLITHASIMQEPGFAHRHPGVFISSQLSPMLVEKILADIARTNAPTLLQPTMTDQEVIDYVLHNPELFKSCPKTLVVISDAPFNSRTPAFKEGRKKLAEFPLIEALFYNCPSFGALSQVLTAHPLVGTKIDTFLATKQAFGEKDKLNKFDEFVMLLRAKLTDRPWLNTVIANIERYRDSIQASIPKQGERLDAQQWQENIRIANGFSEEDFHMLAHENIMHMLGIPEEEYKIILADDALKRSVEWMGKLALTVGLGGAASDFLNWALYVAGIEPTACTKENSTQLLSAARCILTGVLDGTLTPAQKQRAQALLISVNDAEIDDAAVANLMYLANGKIAMILCGTQKVIDALEAQGFKKDVVSKIAPHVTVLPLVDDTFLNEKNALPIAEGGLAK